MGLFLGEVESRREFQNGLGLTMTTTFKNTKTNSKQPKTTYNSTQTVLGLIFGVGLLSQGYLHLRFGAGFFFLEGGGGLF